jgi:hypothetical protein
MKEQIENLLRTEKERIVASDKKKRDSHLISLGLIDKEKSGRIYYSEDGYSWASGDIHLDKEKNEYYKGIDVALDVTDEEYMEICKYFPPSKADMKEVGIKSGAETTLSVIATIVLIGGIIGTLICLFTITWVYNPSWGEKVFNPIGFITTMSLLLVSLTIWASLSVLSNISINVKEINSKK